MIPVTYKLHPLVDPHSAAFKGLQMPSLTHGQQGQKSFFLIGDRGNNCYNEIYNAIIFLCFTTRTSEKTSSFSTEKCIKLEKLISAKHPSIEI